MAMLLTLDKIPRLHNILVLFFAWILLAGFVIMPGSFTSEQRAVDEQSGGIPINLGSDKKLILTKANTATMVVGFVLVVAGTFGTAWLALRWRRNYVWLLNRVYMPLVMNSSVGFIATVIGVYAMQSGEWSTQAIIAALIEASIFVVGGLLFLVYNYWLLMRLRGEGAEEEEQEESKKSIGRGRGRGIGGGFFARFKDARRKPPIAAGSVV
ncbi:hypothetical protein QBC42DRAFT_318519 [Cladorrhinum samala]|uniref:Uncharacterized protein n=1 Tax=Cladorrhinum samala TaxID=585594 RepID=A0AAV9H977_9PEZI|nr:hypothetical protein QBC42DRAFT_318519 [Cladorrhinum samala]